VASATKIAAPYRSLTIWWLPHQFHQQHGGGKDRNPCNQRDQRKSFDRLMRSDFGA